MSNINRDLKVEVTLGEYMDLVSKANLLDEYKNSIMSEVQVKLIASAFSEDGFDAIIKIGGGEFFQEERRQKLFDLVVNNAEVIKWMYQAGKHYYYSSGDYVTDYCYGDDYYDFLEIPEFKRQWEALQLAEEAEVVEVVENDEK